MDIMSAIVVYITAQDKAQAERLAMSLLEARLIACANIIEQVTSLYRWQGRIERGSECVLIAKTVEAHATAVIDAVKSMHSYDCPCVVALPIAAGNPAFLEWIAAETAPPGL